MSACGHEKGLISIDEAIDHILNTVKPLGTENIELQNSLSRYLAQPIHSPVNLPSFDQSAVDGYALCASDIIEKNQCFELIGEIRAGQSSDLVLKAGQATRIFTGGKLPEGCTTIARQEIVHRLDDHRIQITETLQANIDIRRQGEELALGQQVANKDQYLKTGPLAALSMAGVQQVDVYRQPKVAVVITGDEVATEQNSLSNAHVYDANGPLIKAWFQERHIQVEILHIHDEAKALSELFARLKNHYDVIVTTGGVSVGDYDFVRPCAFEVGFKEIFWKVKQKPGKPIFFAKYQQDQHACYLLGLPGNPAAVYVCMQVYTRLLIDALQGQNQNIDWFEVKLAQPLKADKRERFMRMKLELYAGELSAANLANQQSHMLSNLMDANCLVRVPADISPEVGTLVSAIRI
ncbi:molybdopterin molybdotransferase MoeA [uncultured Acinetobacter sp.]|uniref:molybdopterin molybdotransferase MoeA n=1 Tax=uncultured Acinetobacter sp. TaxID=165433 RepID=UPI00258B42FA|nr:molybdopterin molybdotransferase MoeA [uncultured Acinetobacter sp.]